MAIEKIDWWDNAWIIYKNIPKHQMHFALHWTFLSKTVIPINSEFLVVKLQTSSCDIQGTFGIAPSGGITFVSQLSPGSISDKEIVANSGILNDDLWGAGDSVMADGGFLIHEEL